MTRKPKYPHVIKDLDKIIKRLLTEEITMLGIAVEYKTTRFFVAYHVKKKATPMQYRNIVGRSHTIAGRKRRGIANNPTGGKKRNSKADQFGKTYADPLSPVRYRMVRPASIQSKNATFKVQAKLDDGIWYNVDILTRGDDASSLLEQLYLYAPENLDDVTDQDSHNEQESV